VRVDRSKNITVRGLKVTVPSTGAHGKCLYYMRGFKATLSRSVTFRDSVVKGRGKDTRDCGLGGGVFFLDVSRARVSRVTVEDFGVYGIWLENSEGTIDSNHVRYFHRSDRVGSSAGTTGIVGQNGQVVVRGNSVRSDTAQNTSRWLRRGVSVESGAYAVIDNSIGGVGDGIDAWVTRDSADGDHTSILGNSLSTGFGVGVRVDTSLDARVQGNTVRHFDKAGIAVTNTSGSVFTDNRLMSVLPDSDADCTDDSSGSGTSGTANTWTDNAAGGSDPVGICG